jgi:hypothetical protein
MSNFLKVEGWISDFKPRPVQVGHLARGGSKFVYENSQINWSKFANLDPKVVWTLSWPKEDFILTPGFPIRAFQDLTEIVGYVETEKPWSSKDQNFILVVETFVECILCEGAGELDNGASCAECQANGDSTLNFGL